MFKEKCPVCTVKTYDADTYSMCYTCSMKAQGKILCPTCGENYVDPKKYDHCYACFENKLAQKNVKKDVPTVKRVRNKDIATKEEEKVMKDIDLKVEDLHKSLADGRPKLEDLPW